GRSLGGRPSIPGRAAKADLVGEVVERPGGFRLTGRAAKHTMSLIAGPFVPRSVEVLMTVLVPPFPPGARLPDHTQLPETDGSIVQNFQEPPQSILLTDSIRPVLDRLHPDGQYALGQDCGIYFRHTDPPRLGCKAPDWFYVPDVPPLLDGQVR